MAKCKNARDLQQNKFEAIRSERYYRTMSPAQVLAACHWLKHWQFVPRHNCFLSLEQAVSALARDQPRVVRKGQPTRA